MLEKIRYRLVYNRQNKLNRQGTALVQIEAYLNQRKVYFKTNVYLKPECWSKDGAQVINHPQSNELNAMLYEKILELQAIELSYWKRGLESNLSTLKEAVKKGIKPVVSFLKGNYIRLYTYILTLHRPGYCRPLHVLIPFYQG